MRTSTTVSARVSRQCVISLELVDPKDCLKRVIRKGNWLIFQYLVSYVISYMEFFRIGHVEPSFYLTIRVLGSVVMTRTNSSWEWPRVSVVCSNPGDHERPYSEQLTMFVPRSDTGALD